MRVTSERGTFLKSLNHVQSVVERRNTIPILSNVLLQATDGGLKLTATDLDVEIVEQTGADVGQSGSTTVSAHMLYDIVRKLPDGAQLQLEQGPDEGRLSVIAGRSRFSLQALPPQDFPDLASGEPTHTFSMPAADLKLMIEKTRFAISTEETRYYLNGIYLHTMDTGTMRAVATDGHRLARVELAAPEGSLGMPGVIVPRKTVLELAKLIEGMYASFVRSCEEKDLARLQSLLELDKRVYESPRSAINVNVLWQGLAVVLIPTIPIVVKSVLDILFGPHG